MKKMIILLVFVTSMHICFAQDTANHKGRPMYVNEEYLKKSKKQKKTAIILVSAGAALFIAANAIIAQDYDLWYGYEGDNGTMAGVFAITGMAAMLGSIPIFISASKNRKRALSISFEPKSAELIQGNIVHFRSLPSVNFRISF